MNPSLLPKYPDRPRPAGPPENSGAEMLSSRRLTALGMRVVFLVGIWGGLFAFRSVLLPREAVRGPEPRKELIGTWQTADAIITLEFTEDQQVRLTVKATLLFTGKYRYDNDDALWFTDLAWQGRHDLPPLGTGFSNPYWRVKAIAVGNNMAISDSTWPDRAIVMDTFAFPPLEDRTTLFKRKD
jgi:hypothetical protein